MSASRLYTSTSKCLESLDNGRLPLKGCSGSTLSELRAAEVGYNLCYYIGSFVRKIELLNTSRASEILVPTFGSFALLPKKDTSSSLA